MKDILAGTRVLEVASWTFVPAAGAVLADWGADVLKVEHPVSGDPQRGLISSGLVPAGAGGVNYMMEQPNRGKRSVAIDIATPGGRELLYRLAETSDVFLTNFLDGPRQRLHIDVDDIRARNPKIIYVRGSGQGSRGPDAGKPGYDGSSYWARGGIGAALTPSDYRWPIGQRPAFGDVMGGLTIAGGISAALFRREKTGEPSVVDVSLLGLAMWQLGPDVVASKLYEGQTGGMPSFSRDDMPNPLVGMYETSDGRWIMLMGLQPDPFWPDLCQHMDRADLIDDPRFKDGRTRFENRRECIVLLREIFASRTYAEWRERLRTLKGAWAPLQKARELHDDPQAIANGYLAELHTAEGSPFTLVANPVQFDETPVSLTPAPDHGQHTEEVLLELGLSWDDIIAHKESGAIL
jgi:crotonobetainyl-CoA:carnitine CoA-transferase CaiB-like acyl-CoA transferase